MEFKVRIGISYLEQLPKRKPKIYTNKIETLFNIISSYHKITEKPETVFVIQNNIDEKFQKLFLQEAEKIGIECELFVGSDDEFTSSILELYSFVDIEDEHNRIYIEFEKKHPDGLRLAIPVSKDRIDNAINHWNRKLKAQWS